MKHLFVPYDLAVKLKAKLFSEPCFAVYLKAKNWMLQSPLNAWRVIDGYFFKYVANAFGDRDATFTNVFDETKGGYINIAIPLYQQVIDWLREKKDIHITHTCHFTTSGDVAGYIFDICYQDNLLKRKTSKTVESADYYKALGKAIEQALEII